MRAEDGMAMELPFRLKRQRSRSPWSRPDPTRPTPSFRCRPHASIQCRRAASVPGRSCRRRTTCFNRSFWIGRRTSSTALLVGSIIIIIFITIITIAILICLLLLLHSHIQVELRPPRNPPSVNADKGQSPLPHLNVLPRRLRRSILLPIPRRPIQLHLPLRHSPLLFAALVRVLVLHADEPHLPAGRGRAERESEGLVWESGEREVWGGEGEQWGCLGEERCYGGAGFWGEFRGSGGWGGNVEGSGRSRWIGEGGLMGEIGGFCMCLGFLVGLPKLGGGF